MELKFKKEKDAFDALIDMVAKYVSKAKEPDHYKNITVESISYKINEFGDAQCEITFSNDYYILLLQQNKKLWVDINVDIGSNKSDKYYYFKRTEIISDLYGLAHKIYTEKNDEQNEKN